MCLEWGSQSACTANLTARFARSLIIQNKQDGRSLLHVYYDAESAANSLARSIFHICPLRISTFMDRQGLWVCACGGRCHCLCLMTPKRMWVCVCMSALLLRPAVIKWLASSCMCGRLTPAHSLHILRLYQVEVRPSVRPTGESWGRFQTHAGLSACFLWW